MKQRQRSGQRIVLRELREDCATQRRRQLAAVRVCHQFRCAGRASGVEVGGHRVIAFGLAAASLFPVILMGIFFKRINKQGAIAGMLTGLIFTYGYIEFFKGLFFRSAESTAGLNIAENWLFGISPEGIGVIGMLLNFAVAITVSYMTAPPPERIQHMVEHIRVPRHFDENYA